MTGDAVKALASEFGTPDVIEGLVALPPGWTAANKGSLIKPGPSAKTLHVSTLQALADYVAGNRDQVDRSRLVVHVAGPQSVQVLGPLDPEDRVRECFLEAVCDDLMAGIAEKGLTVEMALVSLQARFAPSEGRSSLLKILGTVTFESAKTLSDDGITQTVKAKSGVVLADQVPVPNPVSLAPYRTFRNLIQPLAPYVVRVGGGSDKPLSVSLHEADGGAWKLEAVASIAGWLRANLPTDVAILA